MIFSPSSPHELSQELDSNQIFSALNCHQNAISGILAIHNKSKHQECSNKSSQHLSPSSNSSIFSDAIHASPSSVVLASLYNYHLRQARLLEEMLQTLTMASSNTINTATLAHDMPDELDTISELPTNSTRPQLLFGGPDTLLAQPTRVADASLSGSALARRQLSHSDFERLLREHEELSTLKQSLLTQASFFWFLYWILKEK